MFLYERYIRPLFFSRLFFWILAGFVLLFILAFIFPAIFNLLQIVLLVYALVTLLDCLSLFIIKNPVKGERIIPDRFSNGDDNTVVIRLRNLYPFKINSYIIDELPEQLQCRDFRIDRNIASKEEVLLSYMVRPVERGEYRFYDVRIFAKSPLGLIIRRITLPSETMVKVMPSFLSLRQFELKAHSSNLVEAGNRKVRKIGHSLEFEQIREYVLGDDIRTVNWKATARKGQIMVNNYTDEKSQQVYCIIDKGRVMKMPFEGMSLLDYAINASLAVLRVALIRQDRAGLITFDENIGHVIPADHKLGQMTQILDALYNQDTRFMESDFEKLHAHLRTRVSQRSLIVLFTNFESMSSLHRQLPYLRSIARNHLLLVVFFENTELRQVIDMPAIDLESLYTRTIAEKFAYEKRLIVKELQQHGIFTILTAPSDLTINTVNKYLELKARQAI